LEKVMNSFRNGGKDRFRRVCIQCLNDPIMLSKLELVVSKLKEAADLPVSVSVGPMGKKKLRSLKENGVERVGIAIDGGSESVFAEVKGSGVGNPYTYESTWRALDAALGICGKGSVSTNLIIGLGETDRDVADTLQRANDMGVTVSLFSFTPMKGTALRNPPPSLGRYRALQLMRHYVGTRGNLDPFGFDENGKLIRIDMDAIEKLPDLIDSFRTRGCPDCNRPYYNERPGGPIFNYPHQVDEPVLEEGISLAGKYVKG
jgi:biotin synthase